MLAENTNESEVSEWMDSDEQFEVTDVAIVEISELTEDSGDKLPEEILPVTTHTRCDILKNYGLFNDARNCRGYNSVTGVPEFCPTGVLLHASKSTDMSLSHLNTLKCHRPGSGSNPQPRAQKASAIPSTLPRQTQLVHLLIRIRALQCYDGLVEACGETALPYRTVVRWVRAFNEGRDFMENMAQLGRPSVSEEELQAVSTLLDNDRRQTWVPWDLTEAQRWIQYDTAQTHLERYDCEGDAFLGRIVELDETWARSYEPLLKRQSNEWRYYESPRKTVVWAYPYECERYAGCCV
ncbi:hypothetical protein ANN_01209 [Periplaneta americana]|uniref:Mos1 transposase HTH domain-containing protein n=1 Tax=Periplaneta americana TaxID=6978 RepID=A0ABQ8TSX6_PERAM|nr:hypothetical protein ANN_01209 [Periplaneta americana]